MTKSNEYILPKEKPFETVYELKNENEKPVEEAKHAEEVVRLPMLSEITDKDGKVKLPPEFIEKLRDPNARFRLDLVVFPAWTEEWEDLEISCMARNCGNKYVSKWIHSNCSYFYPSNIQWSTHARLKCPSCYTIADISRWSFRCHGGGHSYQTTDLPTLTDVMIAVLDKPGSNREFVTKFLKSARDIFNG